MVMLAAAAQILLLVLLLRACGTPRYPYVKLGASAAFLAAAVAAGAQNPSALLRLLPALVLFFGGDAALGFYNRDRRRPLLLLGMALFLAGHLWLLGWLYSRQPAGLADMLLTAVLFCVLLGVLRLPGVRPGKLLPAILVYGAAVCAVGAKSVCTAAAAPGPAALVFCAGALGLLASDLVIVFLYFSDFSGRGVHRANLIAYYLGMLLMALSLQF